MVIASSMHPVIGELRTLFLEGVTRSSNIIRSSVKINWGTKGWFSYNRRYRFDRRCQFKKWWDDYMRTLHKRSLMPAAIGSPVFYPGAWIARVLSGRLVADRGDRSDSADYMRTSLNKQWGAPPAITSEIRIPFKQLRSKSVE